MPIFDFKCNKCNNEEEKIVKFSEDLSKLNCNSCKNGKMKKVTNLSDTSFNLKGDFHPTP